MKHLRTPSAEAKFACGYLEPRARPRRSVPRAHYSDADLQPNVRRERVTVRRTRYKMVAVASLT